ncbi:MAG: RNA polymerase sigma factor [Deltaproteobacteria bacterium]|nr:RNA polymerase sigma factor [Deltaproteobacteria bacterium]
MVGRSLTEAELAEHIPTIRRYLKKMLRSDEIADGTQTVLQRALENLHRFRGDSSPRVWLLGIARNVGFEMARARARGTTLADEGLTTGDIVAGGPDQEETLGRREEHALALQALDGLSLDEKLALLVTYVDGVPGPEAAEILGVSFAAFRQRLSRARQALAAKLTALHQSKIPGSIDVINEWRAILDPPAAAFDAALDAAADTQAEPAAEVSSSVEGTSAGASASGGGSIAQESDESS